VDNRAEPGDNLGRTRTLRTDASPLVTVRSLTLVDMTTKTPPAEPQLLRPAQVARLLGVARQTVHDYETAGRLTARRTPGGHRRYPADQPALLEALAAQETAR